MGFTREKKMISQIETICESFYRIRICKIGIDMQ